MRNLEFFLASHLQKILAGIVALVALVFVRAAVQAWRDAVKLDQEDRGFAERLLAPLARRMAPTTDIEVRAMRLQLQRAGLRDDDAVRRFAMVRAVVIAIACGIVAGIWFLHMPLLRAMFMAVSTLYASLKLPDLWLNQQIKLRQARIARALPSVVDLMVLCLDVGLSVEAAFDRVSSEMRSMEPLMAEEARTMVGEMSAGLTFPQALRRMAERVDLPELTTMARLINQASALGASITQALREYSEQSFAKRMLSLEEQAGKISAWLVMPLTVCLLPASLLALAGPAVVILVGAIGN